MKKLFLLIFLAFFGFKSTYAQNQDFVAFTGGYINAGTSVNTEGVLNKNSESGFFAGFLAEVNISHEIWFQPELIYARVNDNNYIQIPILAKFYISEKMNVSTGPQITYSIDDVPDNYSKFNLGAAIGVGYNLTEKILLLAKYTFQINDYYTGGGDFSLKTNFFNVGLAYKINSWR